MIKRYLEFIGESLEFLLESDVVYSDKFRKLLSKIESPIAQKLLDIENKDLPVRSNYFDLVKDKNDVITFLPDRRAQDILKDNTKEMVRFRGGDGGWLTNNVTKNGALFTALGYSPKTEEPYRPNNEESGEVIKKTVSTVSGRTYVWVKFADGEGVYNQDRLSVVDDRVARLWGTGRQEISVGRGIRALLTTSGEKVVDKEIETFVNLYKSAIDKMNDIFFFFEEVKGQDIPYWYDHNKYTRGSGTLNNSCMASVDPSYLDIYALNPEKISMVIYKNPEEPERILGRAILWKLNSGKIFMDRIYTKNDSDVQLFRQYAKENGWWSKKDNNSGTSGYACDPETGKYESIDLTVDLKPVSHSKYPYVDTIKYWNRKTGRITNESGGGDDVYTLEDTDGSYIQDDECDNCGGRGEVDCSECNGRGEVECSSCDGSGNVDCGTCDGGGEVDCKTCDGTGVDDEKDCKDCAGSGKTDCTVCDSGRVDCDDCGGSGETECGECGGRGTESCPECG